MKSQKRGHQVMKHSLTIEGGRRHYYDSGSCSCGQWFRFYNRVTLRGGIMGHKESMKREFQIHKKEAK